MFKPCAQYKGRIWRPGRVKEEEKGGRKGIRRKKRKPYGKMPKHKEGLEKTPAGLEISSDKNNKKANKNSSSRAQVAQSKAPPPSQKKKKRRSPMCHHLESSLFF
jgi:hypothetical protein